MIKSNKVTIIHLMTKEILRNRVVQTSLILLLAGSALTACGNDGKSQPTDTTVSESPRASDNNLAVTDEDAIDRNAGSGPDFRVRYFENGSREVVWEDGGTFSLESIVEWCDGSTRYSAFTAKGGAGGLEINNGDPICDDGAIRPNDFELPAR